MTSCSLVDLCDLADVTPRTVRYYVSQGLLRPPSGAGTAARYDDGHLYRLQLVRQLQKQHLPLAEIRKRLDALGDHEVRRLATEAPQVTDTAADYVARMLGTRGVASAASPAPAAPPGVAPAQLATTSEPIRSQWERLALAPDLELHIRRPLSRDQNRRVERLIIAARAILEEDHP